MQALKGLALLAGWLGLDFIADFLNKLAELFNIQGIANFAQNLSECLTFIISHMG